MLLPKLNSYSADRLNLVAAQSPAFARYFKLISEKPADVFDQLRQRRQIGWLEAVAATYHNTADTEQICAAWSQLADELLRQAWHLSELDREPAALFAMGKLGAQELNLSSDVDLIICTRPQAAAEVERKSRTFRKLISDVTDYGFCFRIDFDLRPGGKSSPIATSISQFQDHYWSRGEAWEKMALVRLRALAGNKEVITAITEHARGFSFRKFLDFNLLQDLKQVRARIHREGFETRAGQIHLKLEKGGIRDIELFINALQILHGGKLPKLQTISMNEAFTQIQRLKILGDNEIDLLKTTYWLYRRYENFAQALDDRQTHFLFWPQPWQVEAWPAHDLIRERMGNVDDIVSSLLGASDHAQARLPAKRAQEEWLLNLGFQDESVYIVWPKIVKATELTQKTDRDERAREHFLYEMVNALSKTANDKDLGLSLLSDFIQATRAKASFFVVLNREPRLVEDLARLFSFSPYLGSLFVGRPELIDNFVLNVMEPLSSDFETMLDEMAERKFLSDIIASIRFLKDLDTHALLTALTRTADELTTALLDRLVQDLGSQPLQLLTLGKWGGCEMGLKSDLDFIFLCEEMPTESEHKAAKRFISRITDPYHGGSLYEIDLRLRPSGKGGPILTTRERLIEYLSTEAAPWERQAYLRGRPVGGKFAVDRHALRQTLKDDSELTALKDIRAKLLKSTEADVVDLKYSAGGLVDVEFASQVATLVHKTTAPAANTVESLMHLSRGPWQDGGASLRSNYESLRQFEQLLCLAGSHKSSEMRVSSESFIRCARFLKKRPEDLFTTILGHLQENAEILKRLDPRQNSVSL